VACGAKSPYKRELNLEIATAILFFLAGLMGGVGLTLLLNNYRLTLEEMKQKERLKMFNDIYELLKGFKAQKSPLNPIDDEESD
jgi:hypothetical protein